MVQARSGFDFSSILLVRRKLHWIVSAPVIKNSLCVVVGIMRKQSYSWKRTFCLAAFLCSLFPLLTFLTARGSLAIRPKTARAEEAAEANVPELFRTHNLESYLKSIGFGKLDKKERLRSLRRARERAKMQGCIYVTSQGV